MVAADVTNHFVYANRAVQSLLGWSPDELVGEPVVSIIPPRVRAAQVAAFERYVRTGKSRIMEHPIRMPALTRDGREVDIELTLSTCSPPGGDRLIVASLRDLGERVELERQLEARAQAVASEQRSTFLAQAGEVLASSLDYETTLSNVAQLAVMRLADWCIVDVVEPESGVRRVATAHIDPERMAFAEEFQRRFPPDPSRPEPVMRIIESGEPQLVTRIDRSQLEASARSAEHLAMLRELAPLSYLCVPLKIHDRVLGAITFLTTETTGRLYSQADLALAQDLARRAAVAVDNARLYRELEESIRVRDEFLSSVSHDLKNPLATIKARAQLLRRRAARLPGDDGQRLVEGLDSIDTSAGKMARLINDLVDLVHLRIGRPLTLRCEEVDLVELVSQVAADQQTAQHHRILVERRVDTLRAHVDAARIERVLANLLSNAVKYSPDGGDVWLVLQREETESGPMAVIAVVDQGMGIPSKDVQHIFERFYRASNTQDFAGTGIGLAGALQIVEQHGGTIDVQSAEGHGTTFTVRLPVGSPIQDR